MSTFFEDIVWEKKPALHRLVSLSGEEGVFDYFLRTSLLRGPNAKRDDERSKELGDILRNEVARTLGQNIPPDVLDVVSRTMHVSTADHHGPLSHPFFVNANLVQYLVNRSRGFHSTVVFACGGVSMGNSSFPRGLLFHDATLREKRVSFVPWRRRHETVYGARPYGKSDVTRALKSSALGLSEEIRGKIYDFVRHAWACEDIFQKQSYADQVTIGNYYLWQELTHDADARLIYLEQEAIVAKLLVQYHLHRSTLLNRLFFDEDFLAAYERNFDGISGAHALVGRKGTVLFWGRENGRRIALSRHGSSLLSHDRALQISLDPESLRTALEDKQIFPCMGLTFIVLSFYYGLRCGGGFSQIDYLGAMRDAYGKMFDELGEMSEKERMNEIVTDCFRGELSLAGLERKEKTVPATGLDLVLYGEKDIMERVEEQARTTKLGDSIREMLPEFYKIITGRRLVDAPRPRPSSSCYVS